jgi:uncharacterized protein with PQ loop repeat
VTGHDTALALGYLGSFFGVVMVIPQIVRILRHPDLQGVSTLSWALSALGCLAWLTYGLRTDSPPQIPGNVLLISGAITVVLLAVANRSRRQRAFSVSAAAGAVLVVAWVMPAHLVGYIGFSIGLVATWPQLYESVGNWRARITSGVSVSTWVLRVASQLCWLGYAIRASDVPVFVSACVSLTLAAVLVALESAARVPAFATRAVTTEAA